jgi:membrane fusion protein, multidrug efflux system
MNEAAETENPPHHSKHKKAILIAIVIFLVLGLAYFCYWFFWLRFHEYTNDAYVDGNMVVVTPLVPGIVISFSALDTDFVPEGRILIELDKTDARIALDNAIAKLGSAVRSVQEMFENVNTLQASIAMKKALFVRAAQDYERRLELIDEGAVSTEDLEHAAADVQATYADLVATEHSYIAAMAQVEGTTVYDHPLVDQGKDSVRDAYVFLQRCTITAPATGIVAQRTVQVGEHVKKGEPLLSIVPLDQMWITSNYKEVQLSKMRVGQPVKVITDIYGGRVVFRGKVAGIGGGTGSVFSVLPPQNATGNWIKIVQRIPVKIDIPAEMLKKHPLRLGLSVETTVDLHQMHLPIVPDVKPARPLYETDVFAAQEEGAEPLIVKIIDENLSPHFVKDMMSPEEN